MDGFNETNEINPTESFTEYDNPKKYETNLEEDIIDDSTNCTDTYIQEEKTDRQKNNYTPLSTQKMGRKKNGDNRETENNKYSEPNCEKKILSHFNKYLNSEECVKNHSLDNKLTKKIIPIPYTTYTQGISYKKAYFSSNIYEFLNQDINNEKPNEKILNELMKDKKSSIFYRRNFLDVFYNDFVPMIKKEEYRKENKIDDKEFEVWKKIIEYKPKKIKEYNNEYEKYGFYQYINEKKERKAQNKYKIVEKIFLIKKIKRDRNSNINLDNQNIGDNNQNVNSNLSSNYNLRNNTNNNSELNNDLFSVSYDTYSFNQEKENLDKLLNDPNYFFENKEDNFSSGLNWYINTVPTQRLWDVKLLEIPNNNVNKPLININNNNINNEEIKMDYIENDNVSLKLNIIDESEINNNNNIDKKENEDNKIELLNINYNESKNNYEEITVVENNNKKNKNSNENIINTNNEIDEEVKDNNEMEVENIILNEEKNKIKLDSNIVNKNESKNDTITIKQLEEEYYIDTVIGDGNCLFYSLSNLIFGNSNYYHTIRQLICDYIENKSEANYFNVEKKDYLSNMRNDKIYGSGIELEVFSIICGIKIKCFRRKINISKTKKDQVEKIIINEKGIGNFGLLLDFYQNNENLNHYSSLRYKKGNGISNENLIKIRNIIYSSAPKSNEEIDFSKDANKNVTSGETGKIIKK